MKSIPLPETTPEEAEHLGKLLGKTAPLPGVREEFVESCLAYVLGQSMSDAKGNQTVGVALALKRCYRMGLNIGRHFPRGDAVLRAIVNGQAEDPILWADVGSLHHTRALQAAIRVLHEEIEGKSSEQCAREALAKVHN